MRYEIREKTFCTFKKSAKKSYETRFEAENACEDERSCNMFYYDEGIKRFILCPDPTKMKDSKKESRVYIKKGKYFDDFHTLIF